jgi:hypothetical protein
MRGYGDLKRIVSLRLSGKERIWDVMEAGVLTVIWWDPEHTVLPSPEKAHVRATGLDCRNENNL